MKYKLTFPPTSVTPNKVAVIRTLRDLCPQLGLKETKDMVDLGGTHVVDVDDWLQDVVRLGSLKTLANYGVDYEVCRTIETDEPEPDIQRTVNDHTLDSLRCVAHDALDRGDHDIAIALIELIKKNS
jgi:hypothetical protein